MSGPQTEVEYLDKWAIYDHLLPPDGEGKIYPVWDPHPGQLVIAQSTCRNRLATCGRRFGKSFLGGKELYPWAIMAYHRQDWLRDNGIRMEYWIVGPEYSDSEKEFRVLYNTCKAMGMPFDKPGTYYDAVGGSMHISLWGGMYQVHGKSSKYPDTLVGEGLHGVVLAEAAKQKRSIWPKYIRPMLADYKGWSLHTSTPEGKNHFHENFLKGQDPNDPEWESWRMPSWANPVVYTERTLDHHVRILQNLILENPAKSVYWLAKEYELVIDHEILTLMSDMTIESFNQEIGADFTEYVGKVFKDWDEEYHVGDLEFNPAWETYGACDYGFTNPNVWLLIQVGPWEEINVLAEIYMTGLTADQFADEIKRRRLRPANMLTFYPDPASPEDTTVIENRLGLRASGGTGGLIKDRINLIRNALKRGRSVSAELDPTGKLWRPQLMFDRSCIKGRAEMEAYKYPDNTDKPNASALIYENPLKDKDHVPEALGRFFIGKYGVRNLIAETEGGVRARKMTVDTIHGQAKRRTSNSPKPRVPAHYTQLTENDRRRNYQYRNEIER